MVHLVFIPSPAVGHIFSTMEFINLLLDRQRRLSVTVLLMALPTESHHISYDQSLATASPGRITFVSLPPDDYVSDAKTPGEYLSGLIDHHKPRVREIVAELTRSGSSRLAGVVLDMFCTTMMDASDEFGVPSYVYFTSGAGFLSLALHALDRDLTEFRNSDTELAVPGFVNSVPAKLIPVALLDGDWSELFKVARFKEAKGILVNTLLELESYALKHLSESNDVPPIYPVGPILNLKVESGSHQCDEIIKWLDDQPTSSVLFLCFGSMGCFDKDQVLELSRALENSGTRFLWSLRRPPPKEKVQFSGNYEDVTTILPEGFLGRTAEIGKVIGWAPQVAILSHPAIGGFVSHCGWNSILESLWFGVPVAAWPLYAEQHGNAFQLVKELGLAFKIKIDNINYFETEEKYLITAKEIENGIKQLMDANNTKVNSIKPKVMEMSKKCRMAVTNGGSSYISLDRFIEDFIRSGSENF